MNTFYRIRNRIRDLKLRYLLRGNPPSVRQTRQAADAIIAWAERDESAGVRKDRVLFAFEKKYEDISDGILKLWDSGEKEACRDIYAKFYEFSTATLEDSYMPLYLSILYRYANALLETGECGRAAELFEKLYDRTDRLIGVRNPYGIHCLERCASAYKADGQPEKVQPVLEEMNGIASEVFGDESAMAMAVRRFSLRILEGIDCGTTDFMHKTL